MVITFVMKIYSKTHEYFMFALNANDKKKREHFNAKK